MAASDGCEAEILGQGRFASTALATEEDVVAMGEKIEGEDLFIKIAIDGAGKSHVKRHEIREGTEPLVDV